MKFSADGIGDEPVVRKKLPTLTIRLVQFIDGDLTKRAKIYRISPTLPWAKLIERLFDGQLPPELSYFDDEGDRIRLGSESEWTEALKVARANKYIPMSSVPLKQPEHFKSFIAGFESGYLSKVIDMPTKRVSKSNKPCSPPDLDMERRRLMRREFEAMYQQYQQKVDIVVPDWFDKAMVEMQERMGRQISSTLRNDLHPILAKIEKHLDSEPEKGSGVFRMSPSTSPNPLHSSREYNEKAAIDNSPCSKEAIAVHHGVICRKCSGEIIGIRYKCGNCTDFDLCEKCEEHRNDHDGEHVFLKLRKCIEGREPVAPLLRKLVYSEPELSVANIASRYPYNSSDDCVPCNLLKEARNPETSNNKSMPDDEERNELETSSGNVSMTHRFGKPTYIPHNIEKCIIDEKFAFEVPRGNVRLPGDFLRELGALHPNPECSHQRSCFDTWKLSKAAKSRGEVALKLYNEVLHPESPKQELTIDEECELRDTLLAHIRGERKLPIHSDTKEPKDDKTEAGEPEIRANPISLTSKPAKALDAKFLLDETVPDGTVFYPGTVFTKKWRMVNFGTADWDESITLKFLWGSRGFASTEEEVPVPHILSKQNGTVSVQFHAPRNTGCYESHWSFTSNGQLFGHRIWCNIEVVDPKLDEYSEDEDESENEVDVSHQSVQSEAPRRSVNESSLSGSSQSVDEIADHWSLPESETPGDSEQPEGETRSDSKQSKAETSSAVEVPPVTIVEAEPVSDEENDFEDSEGDMPSLVQEEKDDEENESDSQEWESGSSSEDEDVDDVEGNDSSPVPELVDTFDTEDEGSDSDHPDLENVVSDVEGNDSDYPDSEDEDGVIVIEPPCAVTLFEEMSKEDGRDDSSSGSDSDFVVVPMPPCFDITAECKYDHLLPLPLDTGIDVAGGNSSVGKSESASVVVLDEFGEELRKRLGKKPFIPELFDQDIATYENLDSLQERMAQCVKDAKTLLFHPLIAGTSSTDDPTTASADETERRAACDLDCEFLDIDSQKDEDEEDFVVINENLTPMERLSVINGKSIILYREKMAKKREEPKS